MSAAEEAERPHKRRMTVRKGTHSCWACKRRKEKCERSRSDLSTYVCRGCKRRGTKCVSQEYPENDAADGEHGILGEPFDPERTHLCNAFAILSRSSPSTEDMKLLREASAQARLSCVQPLGHSSPSAILNIDFGAVETMLKDPQACEAQPQAIARALLQIAVTLQSMKHWRAHRVPSFSEPTDRTVDRCAKAAGFLLSSQEAFDDFEEFQCATLESICKANRGCLMPAWLSCQKAILVGQSMGLPLQASARSAPLRLPGLVATKHELDRLWSHIVMQDQLTSRILGLQPGIFEVSSLGREQDTVLERLETLHFNITARLAKYGLLMSRAPELDKIVLIDQELQAAAKAMTKDWWLIPDLVEQCTKSSAEFCRMRRLIAQMVHFDLRTRLYAPHMFYQAGGGATPQQSDLARETCIRASREALSRSVLLTSFGPMESGLQIPDFLGIIAAVTILIGKICDNGRPGLGRPEALSSNERVMIMQTLANLQRSLDRDREASVRRCIDVLKYLLEIQSTSERQRLEHSPAERRPFGIETQRSSSDSASLEYGSDDTAKPGSTSDCVPYFSAIDILLNKDKVNRSEAVAMAEANSNPVSDGRQPQTGSLEYLSTGLRDCLLSLHSVDIAFVNRLSDSCLQ